MRRATSLRVALGAIGLSIANAGLAYGQACLPPAEPYAYAAPKNDRELRAYINDEYAAYMEGSRTTCAASRTKRAAPRRKPA